MVDVTGSWIGNTAGTNYASLLAELQQSEAEIKGIAILSEPGVGTYAYNVNGQLLNENKVIIKLILRAVQAGVLIREVEVNGKLHVKCFLN